MGFFDNTKKKIYFAEIKAILSLQIKYEVETELTSQQCKELIDRVFENTIKVYSGGMRDFGALFLIELLKLEEDAITHMSLMMVASQYMRDYQIKKALELSFLSELAKQARDRSPN